jgi:hypothetical protein
MPSLDDLGRAFEEASRNRWAGVTKQLSYQDMLNLADTLTGWAMARGVSREWSVRLLGWAESMQRLADKVGPDSSSHLSGKTTAAGGGPGGTRGCHADVQKHR